MISAKDFKVQDQSSFKAYSSAYPRVLNTNWRIDDIRVSFYHQIQLKFKLKTSLDSLDVSCYRISSKFTFFPRLFFEKRFAVSNNLVSIEDDDIFCNICPKFNISFLKI